MVVWKKKCLDCNSKNVKIFIYILCNDVYVDVCYVRKNGVIIVLTWSSSAYI